MTRINKAWEVVIEEELVEMGSGKLNCWNMGKDGKSSYWDYWKFVAEAVKIEKMIMKVGKLRNKKKKTKGSFQFNDASCDLAKGLWVAILKYNKKSAAFDWEGKCPECVEILEMPTRDFSVKKCRL